MVLLTVMTDCTPSTFLSITPSTTSNKSTYPPKQNWFSFSSLTVMLTNKTYYSMPVTQRKTLFVGSTTPTILRNQTDDMVFDIMPPNTTENYKFNSKLVTPNQPVADDLVVSTIFINITGQTTTGHDSSNNSMETSHRSTLNNTTRNNVGIHRDEIYQTATTVLTVSLVSFGSLGNTASLIVLRTMKRTSFTTYMSFVSLSDLVVTSNVMLNIIFNVHKQNGCQWSHFAFTWAMDSSVWLLVSVTIDRYLAVCHPLKMLTYCTTKRANTVSLVIFVVFGVIHITPPMLTTVTPIWEQLRMSFDLESFCEIHLYVFYLIIYNIIPVVSTLMLNGCIIYGLVQHSIKRNILTQTDRQSTGTRSHQDVHATARTLLVVSLFSYLCYIPELFITVCERQKYCFTTIMNPNRDVLFFLSMIGIVLNHCFNFVLYCVSSAAFRKRLKLYLQQAKYVCLRR